MGIPIFKENVMSHVYSDVYLHLIWRTQYNRQDIGRNLRRIRPYSHERNWLRISSRIDGRKFSLGSRALVISMEHRIRDR